MFENARLAKEKSDEAEKREENQLLDYSQKIDEIVKGNREEFKNDFDISIPYVGTSSATIKINKEKISNNIKKYLYVVGDVFLESDKEEETIEDLLADSNLQVTVIAITEENTHLIATQNIKTHPKVYLYNNGNQYTTVTGGYSSCARTNETFSATFNEADIYINCNASYGGGGVYTTNKIDLTEYRYLKSYGKLEDYAAYDSNGRILAITSDNTWGSNWQPNGYIVYDITSRNKGVQTLKCDISELNGEYYICNGFNQSYGYVYSVWLEK